MTTPVDFGTGWSATDSLTMPAILVTGNRVVAEAIVRRWNTPRGGMPDDPAYGYDLTAYLNDDLGPGDLAKIGSQAAAEALKDQRVNSATVTVQLLGGELLVTGSLGTANGPFNLVANVSSVTVTLLKVSP
jgi:hypothetical protein